jgi:uncharacterized protein (TIGR02118 family)
MPALWPNSSFSTTLRRTPPPSIATITKHTFRLPGRYRSAFVCDQQRSGESCRRDRAASGRILHFDSLADLNAALESPEGRAAAADLSNFASAGATLLIYDSKAA